MESDRMTGTQNPFSLSFGRRPSQYISRLLQTEEIIEDFRQPFPTSPVYMITGVRGSGKTVFMTGIARELEQKEGQEWDVIELNPNLDLQRGLAAALYALPGMAARFAEAKIDLSFLGVGLSIENGSPITDYDTALDRMMRALQRSERRLLVCIDEVSDTQQMRVFASTFQMLIRKEYPIYLLMTGLYENIYDLQNVKNLTFLYRAPKIRMEPLNYTAIRASYESSLQVSREVAGQMATLVKGYPYAFQLLGYLYWTRKPADIEDILPLFDQYLDEYVYSKIWSELSEGDKRVLGVMAEAEGSSVKELREKLHMKSNEFSVYRERILRKGIAVAPERGRLMFLLPRFREYVETRMLFE